MKRGTLVGSVAGLALVHALAGCGAATSPPLLPPLVAAPAGASGSPAGPRDHELLRGDGQDPPPLTVTPSTADPPPERTAGGLTVTSPVRLHTGDADQHGGRLRALIDGPLTAEGPRQWVGPEVPAYVPIALGTQELMILDEVPEGHLAFYRDPYDVGSCSAANGSVCAYTVSLWAKDGTRRWSFPLNPLFSRADQIEVQDVRYAGGTLYVNEACQSYAKDAGGKCSSLLAIDPVAVKVTWRSPFKTSNNRFLVLDRYILTGYGFTAEPDFLFLIRRDTGAVAAKRPISSAHEGMALEADGVTVRVWIYPGDEHAFRLEGLSGDKPTFAPVTAASGKGVSPSRRQ